MIRHCVLLKFRSGVSADERADIYADLAALVGQIEGLLSADFGHSVSREGLEQGFVDGFIMDFVDEAARDRYLPHPAHEAAGAKLVAALEGGVAGIVVFDMKIGD